MAATYQRGFGRRAANRLVSLLVTLGVGPADTWLLAVPGRRSGRVHTTPVILFEHGGQRWLVSPYGERQWTRNARTAGRVVLRRGRRRIAATVEEAGAAVAAPVLAAYAAATPITRPYFDARPGDPVEAFAAEASRHPVFAVGQPR